MNKRKDANLLREYAENLTVQEHFRQKGKMELDKAIYASKKFDDELTSQIARQKKVLEALRQARLTRSTEKLQETLSIVSEEQKMSEHYDYTFENIEIPNIYEDWDLSVRENRKFAEKYGIDLSNPYVEMFSNIEFAEVSNKLANDFNVLRLDKYDYAFATFAGVVNGIIDAVFVGTIGKGTTNSPVSKLQGVSDKAANKIVKKYAKFRGWEPKYKKINGQNILNDSVQSAIGFLERNAQVGFDGRYGSDLGIIESNNKLAPANHHLRSLSHSCSVLGLIFGILDIINNTTTLFSPEEGIKIIKNSVNNGDNISNLIKAVDRWFMHIMSDVAGASGAKTRGSGLPTMTQSVFQQFQFGKIPINGKNLNIGQLTEEMYKNGYDIRARNAQAIPVILNELLIRVYWFYKQHFYYGYSIKDSFPFFGKSREIQRLMVVSGAVFSSVDFVHAGVKSKGNQLSFFMSLNYVQLGNFGFHLFVSLKLEMQHRKDVKEYIENDLKKEWEELCK